MIALMGKSTAYVERSHLTARLFNSRLVRKTLAFSKDLTMHRAAATWQDGYYNLIRPHRAVNSCHAAGTFTKHRYHANPS